MGLSVDVSKYYIIFLFCQFDPVNSFKIAFVQNIGLYLFMIVKLIKKTPRPFWENGDISVMFGDVALDYASPSTHIY